MRPDETILVLVVYCAAVLSLLTLSGLIASGMLQP